MAKERLGRRGGQDVLSRREVFFQQQGRDKQGAGVVVKPAAPAAIRGEIIGRTQTDTQEVPDRVVVLGAAQPVGDLGTRIQRDDARGRVVEQVPETLTQGQPFFLGRLDLATLRRHEAFFDLSHGRFPELGLAINRREVGETVETHPALGLAAIVAIPAMLLQLRQEVLMEVRGPNRPPDHTQEQQYDSTLHVRNSRRRDVLRHSARQWPAVGRRVSLPYAEG